MHVVVAVLGDLGRSPRMQYHAQSLLEQGHIVSLLGYKGEELIPALQNPGSNKGRLHVVDFAVPTPTALRKFALPLYYIWRIISVTMYIFYALFVRVPKDPVPDCILMQNPPAIPILLIVYLYRTAMKAFFGKRPGVVIDWHNLGYTMLSPGRFQKLAKIYETALAPLADGHLTVTRALKEHIQEHMNLKNHVNIDELHDCPPAMFRKLTLEEQHEFLTKFQQTVLAACPRAWIENNSPNETLFTKKIGSVCTPRPGRPALIVSSTSWTPDEDFGVLFDALVALDKRSGDENNGLKCVVVVTGKGPEKDLYMERISKLSLRNVSIQTAWLEPGDYPKLLACADIGVSLHTSTSGLDLPMKILDLFGCEVPVCAMSFACLHELVQDKVNGRVFSTSNELCDLFCELLVPLTRASAVGNHEFGDLDVYSRTIRGHQSWNENWKAHAAAVLAKASRLYK